MLKVSHAVKQYDAVTAVNDVSFAAGENEIIGLLGPNGAGKSTLLNMITGYLAPDRGSVTVDGHDAVSDSIAARLVTGYIPETPPLYPDMTVEEHLRFCARLKRIPPSRIKSECTALIAEFGLADVRQRLTSLLSKGYKQRTSFAGALAGNPKLLVFDEPMNGLDPCQAALMRNDIKERSSGRTVIICSHDLNDISEICTRLIIMNKGTIAAEGTISQLQETWRCSSLEDVFLQATGARQCK